MGSPDEPMESNREGVAAGDELATLSAASALPTNDSTPRLGRAETPPAFGPGERLAGRYVILRFIARGGMGEVYEAEDLELRETIALKVIRPDVAASERASERFRREIQLARKVTHPNVCRIFDLGLHHGENGDALFLTMELLRGETLSSFVKRNAPLPVSQALPLVRQVADGLSAAHRAGVVHRDFKSSNVLLVREPGMEKSASQSAREPSRRNSESQPASRRGPDGAEPENWRVEHGLDATPGRALHSTAGTSLRAVITDFGLARSSEPSDPSISGTQGFAGTPAYMAPEQVRGDETTAASDIYAFGVVMYEMLTGRLPFEGDAQATMYRRLFEEPSSPRAVVPQIDPRWEKTVLRCLERDPSDRFASVSEVVRAIEGEVVAPPRGARVHARRRRLAWQIGVAALALLAFAGFRTGILGHWEGSGGTSPATSTQSAARDSAAVSGAVHGPRRSVAILRLRNLSGRPEAEWLSTALSELLGTEIAAGDQMRLIPGENVARMKADLALPEADSYSKETLEKIRTNLGTDLVVLGSYLALGPSSGNQVRLDLRLQDTAAGETLATVTETGTEADLLGLIARTGAKFRATLGLRALSPSEAEGLQAAKPASTEAARLYAEGLESLRLFDAQTARDRFEQAVAAEPQNPLLHSALAEAYSRLGYDQKLRDSAAKAFELSQSLPRAERLAIEGRHREAARDWEKAIAAYQTLFEFYPDNLEFGLDLTRAQIRAGRGRDALATVEALRRLAAPARDDPRIDLVEAQAAGALSDLDRQIDAAGRAAEKGRSQGAKLLVAEASLQPWMALARANKPKEAMAAAEEARRIFAEAGDRGGEARALASSAYLLRFFESDWARARTLYEQAIAISREIGDQRTLANALRGLALLARETKPRDLSMGDPMKVNAEALALFKELGDRSGMAWAMTSLGYEYFDRDELDRAQHELEDALALFQQLGEKDGASNALSWIAKLHLRKGNLEDARKTLAEVTRITRESGNRVGATEAECADSEILIRQGKVSEARSKLHSLLEYIGEGGTAKGIAAVMALLGRVQLVQGDLPGARSKFEKSMALAPGKESYEIRLSDQIGLGWTLLLSGKFEEAKPILQEVLSHEGDMDGGWNLIDAHVALGLIALEEGHGAEVEAATRKSLKEIQGKNLPSLEAQISTGLVRALLIQGKVDDASKLAEETAVLAAKGQDWWIRQSAELLAARAQADSGKTPEAIDTAKKRIQAVLGAAKETGIRLTEFEARLALGEIGLMGQDRKQAEEDLRELEQETRTLGLGYYADRAKRALQPPAR